MFTAKLATLAHMDNPRRLTILKGMEFDTDIAIIGGGLNGTTLALALAQGGQRVTLIDAQKAALREDPEFENYYFVIIF